jgi:outer membrane protein assembly factor BamB
MEMVQAKYGQLMIKGRFIFSLVVAAALSLQVSALDWPQWRGPKRNGVSEETGLLKKWPEGGPKKLWHFDNTGLGYSGPAVANGRVFILGTRANAEVLIALDEQNGKELWFAEVGPILKNNWGDGPRSTPTADGDRVYALGGHGGLVGVNVADGKILWKASMQDLGGKLPEWGYTESVLVDGDQVVCTPGGDKGALAAFDKKTGKLKWQSAEFKVPAQYSSIIKANVHGTEQLIQLTMNDLVGVNPKDGKVFWRSEWPGKVAVIPTPVYNNGHVYITSGYGVGCKLVRIESGNQPKDVYENKVMKNHHGGVVLVGEHLYGFSDGSGWVCQNFKTGEEVWSERSKFRKGAVTAVSGQLYLLEEDSGNVKLIDATPEGWREHGTFTLSPQSEQRSRQGKIWAHPVIANGRLYLRDQEHLVTYDIRNR